MRKRANHANADIKAMLRSALLAGRRANGRGRSTLLRWLRVELDAERKAQIESAVAKLTRKTV